jgi:hypothetical protein
VPESAEAKARRKALARAVERRRRAVAELRLAESLCGYCADQLGNGLSAEEARLATVEAAAELAEVAVVLRRLARLDPAGRRALAVRLAGLGMGQTEIAVRVGVSQPTVWGYLPAGARSRTDRRASRAAQVDAADPAPGIERAFR